MKETILKLTLADKEGNDLGLFTGDISFADKSTKEYLQIIETMIKLKASNKDLFFKVIEADTQSDIFKEFLKNDLFPVEELGDIVNWFDKNFDSTDDKFIKEIMDKYSLDSMYDLYFNFDYIIEDMAANVSYYQEIDKINKDYIF